MEKLDKLDYKTRPVLKRKPPQFDENGVKIKGKAGRPKGSITTGVLLKDLQVIPGATEEAPYGYTKRGLIRKRRSSEDVLQFRRPVVVENKFAKAYYPKTTQRKVPVNNYLKYHRVVMAWARKKYNVSTIHLEMMFFLYDEGIFTKTKFKEYSLIMPFDRFKINRMMRDGWIVSVRNDVDHRFAKYELSRIAKGLVNTIYKMMNGEEKISMFKSTNDAMSMSHGRQRMYNIVVGKVNKGIDEEKKRLRHETKPAYKKPTARDLEREQRRLDIETTSPRKVE